MRILQVLPSFAPEWGGPSTVMKEIVPRLARRGAEVTLCVAAGTRVGTPQSAPAGATLEVFSTSLAAYLWVTHSWQAAWRMDELASAHDVIHIHELWHHLGYRAARAALMAGRPYVISPHGGAHPRALRAKGLKKSLYMWGIQRPQLRASTAVHCLTGYEADQVRGLGVRAPIRVVPHGVVLPPLPSNRHRSFLTGRYPELIGKKVMLFLGRLHRSKGLYLLVEAYYRLPAEFRRESALVLVGPDEGYRRAIEGLVTARGLEGDVILTGPLFGEEKTAALYGADLFVMPSLSEGFSMAVLEALAHSLPVLITSECHFPEVETQGAGMIVPTDPTEMSQAMVTLLAEHDRRQAMGQAGRRLVESEYSWEICVDHLMELYSDCILGRAGRAQEGRPCTDA